MIVDKRGIAFFLAIALATTTTRIHDSNYSYSCEAFTFALQKRQSRNHDCQGSRGRLRAFPSDYDSHDSPERMAQLQNDHFVVSKTTSTFSEPAVATATGTTPIAPPQMARPSTETKTNEHALTRTAAAPPRTKLPSIWERDKPVIIQGGSQRTWSFYSSKHNNMVQVHTRTEGNPMYATVDLWQGPGNEPQKIKLYSEDGLARPFRCFLPVPNNGGGVSNSINIRNTATTEFPLQAILEPGGALDSETNQRMNLIAESKHKERMVQGGSTVTERFEPNVKALQVFVSSEGRPINCRIELVSGPNNVKQVMEIYSDEGQARPFYAVLETPGYLGGILRVINAGTIEFPFCTIVAPWEVVSKREMHRNMNLGGTSQPLEITGTGSSFGNVVAQMGGFGNSISMGSMGSMGGMGGIGAAAATPVPAKKTRVFAPAAKPKPKATAVAAPSSNSDNTNERKNMPLPPVEKPPVTKKNKNSSSKSKDVTGDNDGVGSTEKILMNIWDKKLESEEDTKARRKAKEKSEAAADAKTILYDANLKSSGKSRSKQNLEFIDADIDMECAVDEDNGDMSCESVEDDIEARIEAEVERRLKESRIQEEKQKIAAEAKAAAAAAASLEENIRKERELKEKIRKERELKEHIEAEAKARFDARIRQEQKEIEHQRMEIERMNTEMEEKEARLRVETQEEIGRKKQTEGNKPKPAPTAPLPQQRQQQQRHVHRTQAKKPVHVVLDIDDAFK